MTALSQAIAGKRVFITGHSGFTGSWLSLWLSEAGCAVTGYSLAPDTSPNLFTAAGIEPVLAGHHVADIRDYATLAAAMADAKPEVVFHLAAQPLVRRSYADPLETISINVVGTANVLEAARNTPGVRALVCITTDKVYENREWRHPYREGDELGGKDAYSSSKACTELVARSYQQTMSALGNGVKIATARGGNIIGGGDWAEDRIVPDFYRAAAAGAALSIRSPDAVRPWQHVLSACHGYIAIARDLLSADADFEKSWNIGPADCDVVSVRDLVTMLSSHSDAPAIEYGSSPLKEAGLLRLDISKAKAELGFVPPWTTAEVAEKTAKWYGAYYADSAAALEMTKRQLAEYRAAIGDDQQ